MAAGCSTFGRKQEKAIAALILQRSVEEGPRAARQPLMASSESLISKEAPVTKRNGLCARTKPKALSALNRWKVGSEHRLFGSSWNKTTWAA